MFFFVRYIGNDLSAAGMEPTELGDMDEARQGERVGASESIEVTWTIFTASLMRAESHKLSPAGIEPTFKV